MLSDVSSSTTVTGSLPLEVKTMILKQCTPTTLATASLVCSQFRLEAERVLYGEIMLRTWQSMLGLCATLTSDNPRKEGRAELVRQLKFFLSDDATAAPLEPDTGRARFISSEAVELVRNALLNLKNLSCFGCDWYGPSHGILSALPRQLLHLRFAFDLDDEAVAGLRKLKQLDILRVIPRVIIRGHAPDGPPPPHRCGALKKCPSKLRRLSMLEALPCCAQALVPGRAITTLFVSGFVGPVEACGILLPPTKGVAIRFLLLHVSRDGQAVLDSLCRYAALEIIDLRDATDPSKPGQRAATEAGIGAFICAFPRLRQLFLTTTTDNEFKPEALDTKGMEDMFKRWVERAAKSLDFILFRKVVRACHPEISHLVGGNLTWHAAWDRSLGVSMLPRLSLQRTPHD